MCFYRAFSAVNEWFVRLLGVIVANKISFTMIFVNIDASHGTPAEFIALNVDGICWLFNILDSV